MGDQGHIKRLDDLVIEESSGVDHPANLADGWIVVKEEGRMPDKVEKAPGGPHAYKPSGDDPGVCAVCGKKDADGMHKGFGATKKEEGQMPTINKEGLSAEQLAAVEALEAHLTKTEADKVKAEADLKKAVDEAAAKPEPKVEPDLETIRKAVDESERLRKAAEEETRRQTEVNKTLEERVSKMEREKQEAAFITKAKDLANLSTNPATLGLLLLDVAEKVPDETFKQLDQLLKAANAQLERSELFRAVGHPLGDEDSLEARIQKLAEEMVTSGAAATVPIAKAKVLETNSEIRNEYIERRRRDGR